MGEFRVHHIRFYEYVPKAIHCLAYTPVSERLAVSRSDGSIEIWSIRDDWYQEKIIPPSEGDSVEGLVWHGIRLFSAGLDGNVKEIDVVQLKIKRCSSSNAGPIWCLTKNSTGTQLAAGTEDGCVVLFEIDGDKLEYIRAFDKQEGRIMSICWHASEDLIVTGGIDNIRLWSVNSGRAMQRLTLGKQDKNQETVVWCVAITSDMTIISGDSRGKTTFWNGKHGTLLKSFQSHKADVLSLAVNQTEDVVYTSGIDPSLVQFDFTTTKAESDWKMWVKSVVHSQHTHDVRALTTADNFVVSGGVDTNLIFNCMGDQESNHHWRRIPPVPHLSHVSVAREAKVVLLRYPDYVEVWKLGHTDKEKGENGDILPLRSNPVKLIQLKSKSSEPVICAAISHDATFLAYSDVDTVRVYSISLKQKDLMQPQVSMKRLCSSPSSSQSDGTHCMAFTRNSKRLIKVAPSRIHILSLEHEEVELQHTFHIPHHQDSFHLLSLSPDDVLAAITDHQCNIYLYNLETKQYICNLPKYKCQATALSFSPDSTELVVAYADQMIYEFSVLGQEYTEWCKQNSKKYPDQWMKRHNKITHIMYNPHNPQQILLSDEQMFCILDKSQPFPKKDAKMFHKRAWQSGEKEHKQRTETAFHVCPKYKYIYHMDALEDNWLVIAERTPVTLYDMLPPTLKQKKFGI
ncbi:hypothetical protein CHS0354_018919 [Potamilus streckersoni]|uniref:Cirhin n=1 Tax=Potamilus streckersoni TaxID=2493646 RepID=A0AAE0RMP7_9BIVA|nr:hypothetical protein CHS0354_018919 [Potamilus streckersoni]